MAGFGDPALQSGRIQCGIAQEARVDLADVIAGAARGFVGIAAEIIRLRDNRPGVTA